MSSRRNTRLERLLSASNQAATQQALAVLRSSDVVALDDDSSGRVCKKDLIYIYERRQRLADKFGRVRGNFAEVLAALTQSDAEFCELLGFDVAELSFLAFIDARTVNLSRRSQLNDCTNE